VTTEGCRKQQLTGVGESGRSSKTRQTFASDDRGHQIQRQTVADDGGGPSEMTADGGYDCDRRL
jgi:hypothetical protein